MISNRKSLVWLALLVLTAAGCGGDGLGRVALEGTVNMDGAPLETGNLTLLPTEGTEGPSVGAMIADGKFHMAEEDGPVPGKYRVEIRASRPTGRKIVDSFRQPPDNLVDEIEQFIPRQYNVDSGLTLDVDEDNEEAHFDLRSQNGS